MKTIEPGDIVLCVQKYGDARAGDALKAESRQEDLDHNSGWYWTCHTTEGYGIALPEAILRAVTIPGIQDAWERWHTGERDFLHLMAEFQKRPASEQIAELEKALDTELKRMEANFAENKKRTIEYYQEQIEALRAEVTK